MAILEQMGLHPILTTPHDVLELLDRASALHGVANVLLMCCQHDVLECFTEPPHSPVCVCVCVCVCVRVCVCVIYKYMYVNIYVCIALCDVCIVCLYRAIPSVHGIYIYIYIYAYIHILYIYIYIYIHICMCVCVCVCVYVCV
jgi:hypothetical protein